MNQLLGCVWVSGTTNYQYRITHPASGFTAYYTRGISYQDFSMNRVTGIGYGKTYNVEVRAYVGGLWTSYGVICTVTTPATIPLTKLRPADCGATLAAVSTLIYCNGVPVATNYQYNVINTPAGFNKTYTRGSSFTDFQLSRLTGVTVNTTYQVRVRSMAGGVWSAYGDTCQVTTGPIMRLESDYENIDFSLNVYPNPIGDDVLHYTIEGAEWEQEAMIEVYDMVGTKIYSEQIIYQPGNDAVINIDDKFSKGVYFLNATINGRRFHQKFVVVK